MSGPLIPSVCYQDANAAIAWLDKAFGFAAKLVVPGPNDTVMHSQLVCEDPPCMVMVFTQREGDEFGSEMRSPRAAGACTQSIYVVVADDAAVDAHHDRAKAAGAEITLAPADQDYGGRVYTCKDLEGHVWSFGSYDPRAE